jgi:endonuclease/exonuclease/phosphatase (EEP) superfamily protein YafD
VPRTVLFALLVAALHGCASATVNYTDPAGPRYAAAGPSHPEEPDTLRVVSFNVKFAEHVPAAIALLREPGPLREMDVLLLQEMDEVGTRQIADALGFAYVYYPATLHPLTGRDFGNAILSRFPIEDDRKILMPHLARFRHTLRAAVGATIRVGTRRLRVYSIHVATVIGNGPQARREQLAAVLADAAGYPTVLVGGDFNSSTVPDIALARGYTWPTRRLAHTASFWTMDHILLRGLTLTDATAFGLVREVHGASDHKPVWARVVLQDPQTTRGIAPDARTAEASASKRPAR